MSLKANEKTILAIILTAVIAVGSTVGLLFTIPQLADGSQMFRDYSLSASPSSLSMSQGSTVTTTITASSVNGFDLSVGLTAAVTGSISSFLLASLSSNAITPASYGRTTATLTVTSLVGTPAGSYQITITSLGGTKSHTITISVVVGPADFTINANPAFLTIVQGQYNTTTLTVTSIGGFYGNVSLSATTPLAVIGIAGGPSPIYVIAGGAATSLLSIDASTLTNPGVYTITAIGTSKGLTHSASITVTVNGPTSVREAMSMDSASFNSSTSVDLVLRNNGSANVTLVAYYVKDPAGDQYARVTWSGPSIAPNAVASTLFVIGSSCSGCTLSGTAFTFQPGTSYQITVITARNNQFTFTVIR